MPDFCVVVLTPLGQHYIKMPVTAATGDQAMLDMIAAKGIVQQVGMQAFAFDLADSSTVRRKVGATYSDILTIAEILPN